MLSTLLALSACTPSPCMDGYGRDADGNCVALAVDGDDGGGDLDTDDPTPPEDTGDPSDDGGFVAQVPEPGWTADQVAAEIELGLSGGVPEPLYAVEEFLAIFDGGDANCPQGSGYNLPADFDGCRSQHGYFYAGLSTYQSSNDGNEVWYEVLADFQIHDDQERWFMGGGELAYTGNRDTGVVEASVLGTWAYPGAERWLGAEMSGAIWLEAADDRVVVEGAAEIGGISLYMGGLDFDVTACPAPAGTIQVRDDAGYWYEIVLPADCSGCGPVTYGGAVEVGEVCLDLDGVGADLLDALAVPSW